MLRLWLTALLLGRDACWNNTYLLKVATNYVFTFFLVEVLLLLLLLLLRAAAPAHNISTEAERGTTFSFLVAALLLLFTHREGCAEKIRLVSAFCLIRVRNQSRSV